MIGMNQRFAGAHVKAKELISQGAIGKILTFRTAFGHSGPENWSVDAGNGSWFSTGSGRSWESWRIWASIKPT